MGRAAAGRVSEGEPAEAAPPPTLPLAAAGWGLVALVLGVVAAGAVSFVTYELLDQSDIVVVVCAQLALWSVLLLACRRVSHRRGTGDLGADYGFEVERRDLGRGVVVWALGLVSVGIALSLVPERFLGTNTELEEHFEGDVGFFAVAVIAIVGAPIVEELFFRGLLLRGLLSRLRPGWAVLGQALVFSVVHVDPLRGAGNVSVVVSTATLGLVFGWSAVRYGRLGPGMVAHAIQNSAATALVLLTE